MTTDIKIKLPENWANPRVLIWARQRLNLSYEDVGKKLDVLPARIADWETNKEKPTLSELENLADIYDCPVGYFFLDSPPVEKVELDYRGLKTERVKSLSYESQLSLREFLSLTDYITQLEASLKIQRTFSIEKVAINEPIIFVAKRERERFGVTQEIRATWQSPNDAFEFWRNAIEARGVFVISLKLNPQEIRGASRWDANHPPAILVNRADMESATGRCFTLLHEWSHLLVNQPGLVCDFHGQPHTATIEHFANRFAAEVLVPHDDFEQFLKNENLFEKRTRWGDEKIRHIGQHFQVSKDVIAIKLEENNLADKGFYQEKLNVWYRNKPFFRISEKTKRTPGSNQAKIRLTEIGMPTARLISSAYDNNLIPELELAHLLKMKVEKAEGFVSWVKEGAPEYRVSQ